MLRTMAKFPFIALPHALLQILGTKSSSSAVAFVHTFHNVQQRKRAGSCTLGNTGFSHICQRLASSSNNEDDIIKLQASVSKSTSKSLTEEDHLIHQAGVFDEISDWFADREKEVPPELEPIYQSMAEEILSSFAPKEEGSSSCHILDVACGTGVLWEFLINEANKASLDLTITGVDLSPAMVNYASERAMELSSGLGDDSAHEISVVESDVILYCQNLKESTSFDGVILNACFGNFFEPRRVLEALPGKKVCISHPLGAAFVKELHLKDPKTVPNLLPENPMDVATLIHGLPLVLSNMSTEPFYLTTLQKCRAKGLANIHRYRGCVDQGYGRGGRKLGFPTANLPASLFKSALEDVATGVYFGWAALENHPGNIYKAVVNVGYSPTFEGKENKEKIIEAHLILQEGETLEDFYGKPIRLQLIAFLREEQKFDSFPELVAQINADVQDAERMLNMTPYQELRADSFLQTPTSWVGNGGGDETASWEFSPMLDQFESVFQGEK
jgi:riboflavin kinase